MPPLDPQALRRRAFDLEEQARDEEPDVAEETIDLAVSLRRIARHAFARREEGAAAFRRGERLESNPYNYTEEESAHDEWFFGWQAAAAESRKG